MTDNINEEPLNDPKIPPSENLSTEIISTNDADTAITNQGTENTEVHHHPDLHHKRKTSKNIFWNSTIGWCPHRPITIPSFSTVSP